jgi:hypothetical protein
MLEREKKKERIQDKLGIYIVIKIIIISLGSRYIHF